MDCLQAFAAYAKMCLRHPDYGNDASVLLLGDGPASFYKKAAFSSKTGAYPRHKNHPEAISEKWLLERQELSIYTQFLNCWELSVEGLLFKIYLTKTSIDMNAHVIWDLRIFAGYEFSCYLITVKKL